MALPDLFLISNVTTQDVLSWNNSQSTKYEVSIPLGVTSEFQVSGAIDDSHHLTRIAFSRAQVKEYSYLRLFSYKYLEEKKHSTGSYSVMTRWSGPNCKPQQLIKIAIIFSGSEC
jgi:hypothetical protein